MPAGPLALDAAPKRKIIFGLMKGEFVEPADFDAPLPEDLLALFAGRESAEAPAEGKL